MNNSGGFFDVAAGREELSRIEDQASSPDFWNDQEAAQKLLQKRSRLEKKIQRQEHFESQIADAGVLFEFAEEDEESLKELRSLVERLEHELSQAETEMLLAGDNDQLQCYLHHSSRRRRHRIAGLGRDATAHVSEMGRATRIQNRDH